ncbi:uncharacterized protein LOC142526596 [Primulina tabacum]|uniref:uncharacterized protein LOC142526596 n=1 Tax=Primulina tabacum TaxID=48773 RepID=UPI003F59C829
MAMAMLSQISSNSILSFKLVLISTIFLSAGIMLKFSAPAITDFAVYEVPSIYNGFVSWLRPPYLYLVINCIIISIVASSKLQSRKDDDEFLSTSSQPLDGMVHAQPQPVAVKGAVQADEYEYNDVVLDDGSSYDVKVVENGIGFDAYENLEAVAPSVVNASSDGGIVFEDEPTSNKENEYVTTKSTRKDTKEYSAENVKSPASARFGNRRNLKVSPEGGAKAVLRVSKPKKQDTLESTWKTITEGRAMPLTRHLRKNETWEKTNTPKVIMTKTETFNDRTNARSPLMTPSSGSGKLRKEPSLSQDELNRRVEAFIKKFNEDMRLQRQESLNQYEHMVNHGSC